MLKRILPVAVLAPLLGLNACFVSDEESTDPEPRPNEGFKAQYVPLGQVLPFGNDIFLAIDDEAVASDLACTEDGLINLSVQDNDDLGNPVAALNCLDGFSPISSAFMKATDAIDEDSIEPRSTLSSGNVALVDITDPSSPSPLTHGEDYEVEVSEIQQDARERLFFRFLEPAGENRRFLAVVTDEVESSTGANLAADRQFQLIKDALGSDLQGDCDVLMGEFPSARQGQSMVRICDEVVRGQLQLAAALGYSPEEVAVAWSFETQTIQDPLAEIAENVEARTAAAQQVLNPEDGSAITTQDLNENAAGYADIWAGFMEVPYYLNPEEPLTGFWQAEDGKAISGMNPMPQMVVELEIPVFITIPNDSIHDDGACIDEGDMPENHPVVIFQHGITRNRTDAVGIADSYACRGFAVVSIDHPLHGLVPDSEAPNPLIDEDRERHFFLDVDGDGEVDASGSHYINPAQLLTSRDNLRQSVADLIQLSATLQAGIMEVDSDGNPTGQTLNLDGDTRHFVGHSLGGMAGASFLAFDEDIITATLGMPGGFIAQLLQDSVSLSEAINPELEAQGIIQGTRLYDDFFRWAQTVIDSGDPANFGSLVQDRNILMFQVADDLVVPNSATAYLADAQDLPVRNTDSTERGLVRYVDGDHSSLLDPSADAETTQAMQCQMVTFSESGGMLIDFTNCGATGRTE